MTFSPESVHFHPLLQEHESPLAELFAALTASGDYAHFHPHPLDAVEAAKLVRYSGKDFYGLAIAPVGRAVGYGMLRGWDEGFESPSLGIALHPDWRRHGLGLAMMEYLHAEARRRGAARVRLTVDVDNESAVRIYLRLGYEFEGPSAAGRKVAWKVL